MAARARQARDDSALYPRRRQHDPRRYQPLGPARREPGEATAARLTVARPRLEVADIFRTHGSAWCRANAGHVSLGQLKVMSAIETCRTAALGGHVERCNDCAHVEIAYNSCRNRHCPKCQGAAARQWLEAQRDDLLPVAYYHLVFTLPAPIAPIAFPEQDRRLRPAVQGRRRDADRHCGQPKTLGGSRWLHRRAAQPGARLSLTTRTCT